MPEEVEALVCIPLTDMTISQRMAEGEAGCSLQPVISREVGGQERRFFY